MEPHPKKSRGLWKSHNLGFLPWLAGALALLGAGSQLPAQALNLQNYNVFTFNDLNTSSHVDGRVFIGHDFTNTGPAVFSQNLTTLPAGDRTMVVVHDLIASGNAIHIQNGGNLYISGTTNNRPVNYNGGGAKYTDTLTAADVQIYKDQFIGISQALDAMAQNNTVSVPNSQPGPLLFNAATANADGVAIFDISGDTAFNNSQVQQIQLNITSGVTSVVINVSGATVNWTNGNMVGAFTDDYWQGHVIWNFYEATTITTNSRNFNGAILAPYATVNLGSGNLDGAIVANTVNTTAEIHLPTNNGPAYSGYLPVPEPGACFLVGLATMAFIARRRFRR